MSENLSDTAAAVEAGRKSAIAANRIASITHPLDPRLSVPVTLDAAGQIQVAADVLGELDRRYAARPRQGTTVLTEVDSFVAHVVRWGSEATVVYADAAALSLNAVLDDHPADPTGTALRQHRATYSCPRSTAWKTWTELDGKPQAQTQFADFVEAHLEDLVGAAGMPAPTEVLQVARNLTILTKGTFQREFNPTNGDSILVCKTETDAKSTPIPRAFMLAIPVFEGGDRYQIEARVRCTLVEGRPSFVYLLHRRAEIERDAFVEVRTKVGKETGRLVLAGTP